MPETCVVFGATGNTGSRVADGLLAAGKRVRVVGRSRERLARFAARGAEACALDATDTAAVGRALDGATAAYVMVPPLDYSNPNCDLRMQDAVSESLVAAIRASGIRFVVNLSSLGADRVGMMEQVDSLRRHELRLRTIAGLNLVHLRPGLFMESLLDQARTVATAGFFAYTLDPAVRIPMIAAADIARAALDRLLALDFRGESSVELAGPCDVSMGEAAAILGRAAGMGELPYLQIPYDELRWSLQAAGVRSEVIDIVIDTNLFLNGGRFTPSHPRGAEAAHLTTLEQFAPLFVARVDELRARCIA